MLNSAIAAVFLWTALFTTSGVDPETIIQFDTEYATTADCDVDAATLKNMINSNDELVERMLDRGYEGMFIICTDDPDPFSTVK
jgi:hypothetical protein